LFVESTSAEQAVPGGHATEMREQSPGLKGFCSPPLGQPACASTLRASCSSVREEAVAGRFLCGSGAAHRADRFSNDCWYRSNRVNSAVRCWCFIPFLLSDAARLLFTSPEADGRDSSRPVGADTRTGKPSPEAIQRPLRPRQMLPAAQGPLVRSVGCRSPNGRTALQADRSAVRVSRVLLHPAVQPPRLPAPNENNGLKTKEWKACGRCIWHRGFEGEEVGRERGENPPP